jgi:hypothetical protein
VAYPLHLKHDLGIMPLPRRFSERLLRARLYLLFTLLPFTAMAIPVITEFSRSSTPNATDTDSSQLVIKGTIDIGIPIGG